MKKINLTPLDPAVAHPGPDDEVKITVSGLTDLLYHAFWAGVNEPIVLPQSKRTSLHRDLVDKAVEGCGIDWQRL